ncbi:MAG TPA: FtsK/SpoIIIE domain-containing protein [Anaerolineales bacterium]|nr:FtsK/SpoIIIE domain-containing protein [Anaerolineales bacterium]
MADKKYIDRPPRIEPQLPAGIFTIPNPPDTEVKFGELLQQAFLPMIMILGYLLASLFGQGRSMVMMIPMLLSVVATVALAVYTNSQERKQREAAEAAYKRRIGELRRKMESEHEQQRIYYFYNYPDPEKTLGVAADINRNPEAREEEIRSGTRLWERRPKDHDFLYLRLGISTRQSTVIYKISENEKTESTLMREAIRLSEDSRLLYDVPVTIPLYLPSDDTEKKKVESKKQDQEGEQEETQEAKGITVRHSIGITGSSPEKIHAYLRTMLVDYAAFHSPQDAMLYVAGTNDARQHWRWAYALPHCKEADKTETLLFEREERPGENEADRMRLFWKNIRTILDRRSMRLADRESGTEVKLPFLLVVVDACTTPPEWSCLRDLESEAAISTILLDGQKLGAGIIFLTRDRTQIPSRCTAVIEVDDDVMDEDAAVFRYAETGFNTVRYVGKTLLVTTQEKAREFSRNLEPLDIRRGYGSSLASTVTLLEMLNLQSIDELQEYARENWKRSMSPNSADWLYTAVGLLSGNEPRVLTFSAKADGVHGLIAGSTGSGKSELLMTLIIGMALNFSPDVLNFVLIDYKGGAAFEPFKRLPHKVDIVTNLDQSATARVFASIIAELDRRQKLNTYTNSKDIVHYRRKGLNLEPESPPYPHLFIIIDEFAEMISGNAEYKAQLESITRLGRALGVTLILAAQRPVGVTDQMRANIKFRICLRVETPDDSRELLRRSDAAYLPPGIPGRGYLQVGNENIELIQTAYTGGDYKGPQEENAVQNVIWLDRPRKSATQKTSEPPKLYDVIVEMMANLSVQESRPQWRPWPEFLPMQTGGKVLSLQTPLDTAYMNDADIELLRSADSDKVAGFALNEHAVTFWDGDFKWKGIEWGKASMRPLVGIIDNPYLASQKPLKIDFPNGHSVIFGASGRGKTTFLRTVVTGLALTHSPDELHIYILDLGGRALTSLGDLPHVGAVITSEEEERVLRTLRKINDIIDSRQILFSEARVNSLDSYNISHPDKRLPAILVVIDNFAEFKEYYEGLMGPLISLVRESRAYGVHFLFSADLPNALTGKLYNLITERFTLKLSDPSEYSEVVGRGVPADLSAVPGRGYVRVGNTPLEFQTALTFTPEENDPDGLGKISKMCIRMKELWGGRWKGEKPSTVETLPLRILLDNVLQQTTFPEVRRINASMGIDDRSLEPALIDIERQGPHMVIIGQPFSGKTTAMRTMILSIAEHYSPDEVMMVLVDYSRKLWKGRDTSLADIPHVVEAIDDIEQLDAFYENLLVECEDFETNPKRRKIMIFIDNYDAFTDESSRKKMAFFENLSALIRKYQTAGVYLIVAGSLAIMSSSDDLRKIYASTNFGIALRSADAVSRLNGKFPRSLADTELPMGRAFIIRSGITSMLQLATPYANDDDTEGSLDIWVQRIKQRQTQAQVQWLSQAPSGKSKKKDKKKSGSSSTENTGPMTPDVSKYNIPTLKQKLVEAGMPEDMISLFSDADIVENARTMGLLDEKPENEK